MTTPGWTRAYEFRELPGRDAVLISVGMVCVAGWRRQQAFLNIATDRARVNEFIAPELRRYHQALENIGISYADRGMIDVNVVLNDPTAVAIIKNIGETARFVQVFCNDLIEANNDLIASLEAELADR